LFIIFAVSVALPFPATGLEPDSLDEGLYRYNTVTGDERTFFIWEKKQLGGLVKITVHDHTNSRVMENTCQENGETVSWLVKDPEREIRAERDTNALRVYGNDRGKVIDVSYAIDERNWFQPMSFSLTGFLFSDEKRVSFWTIRQDTLELLTIVAVKEGMETLEINGANIPAFKVEVRLEGFLSAFWHGSYWYRLENGQFLKYRAVNGPPGTPETVITLAYRLSD
jgi:hypothetical protein